MNTAASEQVTQYQENGFPDLVLHPTYKGLLLFDASQAGFL